ncbi:2OG-Fe(II) oxygenase [Novosphingobium colocasiae]|uniref:Proline hydroxylase n=1 Tax=Novosphingobium colocasiae TaxID=1256513 RepID=A0A918UGS1_9SPHN|nr:2OG-Fe(II) oxygenase family protein [Novosphingobium colocasiae]GGZ06382.1 proline hydroxylase [Novosphingobium colocasiae]
MQFALAPRSDIAALAQRFASQGFVSIDGLLPDDQAEALAASLRRDESWVEVLNAGEKVYEIALSDYRGFDPGTRKTFEEAVARSAREGFQFHFRTIRVPDDDAARRERDLLVDRFARFLNSAAVLELLKAVTGRDRVNLLDAQATLFAAGHFLSSHDDDVAGKNRQAAYVVGLSRGWQPDWGGLLLFPDGDDLRGFVPAFNSMRLFAVPRQHCVTQVASWVEEARLSITGWLRVLG